MDPRYLAQLRLQILQALEGAPSGHDLADLHALLSRSRRDASMLPAISALIGGGYCEKVRDPVSIAEPWHRGEPAPVRFRLTSAGRALLHPGGPARGHAVPAHAPGPGPRLTPVG